MDEQADGVALCSKALSSRRKEELARGAFSFLVANVPLASVGRARLAEVGEGLRAVVTGSFPRGKLGDGSLAREEATSHFVRMRSKA